VVTAVASAVAKAVARFAKVIYGGGIRSEGRVINVRLSSTSTLS
jgi:hypothetical protein